MSNARKILIMTMCIFAIIMLFTFIGFHIGYDGLLLVGEINLPVFARIAIEFILFSINSFLIMSTILAEYTKKIWKILIPFLTVWLPFSLFFPGSILATIVPVLYVLVWSIHRKDFKKSFLRFLIITGIICAYQFFSLILKVGYCSFEYNSLTMYQELMVSIDLIIFLTVIYAVGGEKYVRMDSCKLVLFPAEIQDPADDHETSVIMEQFQKLQGFKRLKGMSLLLGFQIIQWGLILLVCTADSLLLEGAVITTSFIAFGFIIQKRWHSKSILICTLSSVAMFYIAAKVTISFHYSQFFSVIIGLLLIYALYRIAICTEQKDESIQYAKRVKELEKEVANLWHAIDDFENRL